MNRALHFAVCLGCLVLSACANSAPVPEVDGDRGDNKPVAGQFESDLRTHEQLRFDCAEDSDCAVKNVGNCCGYYPACVHVDSPTDPAAVAAECAQRDLAGICGYPVIETCVCVANRCRDVAGRDAETLR